MGTTFVDTYTEMIIDMLTKDVTPEMICSNLGLCTEDFEQHPTQLVEVESLRVGGPALTQASRTRPTRQRSSRHWTCSATVCPLLFTRSASSWSPSTLRSSSI